MPPTTDHQRNHDHSIPRARAVPAAGLVALLVAAASAFGACSNENPAREGGDGGRQASEEAPALREDTPLGRAVVSLRQMEKGESWRADLEEILSGWRGQRQPMTDLIRATYRQRGYQPLFIDGLWPSASAAVLVKAVREVPSHGLPASPYRPKAVEPLFAALALDPEAASGTLTEPIGDNERLAELEWQLPRSVYRTPRRSEKVPEVRYRPPRDLPELTTPEPEVRCLLEVMHLAAAGREKRPRERIAEQCGIDDASLAARLETARGILDERREHRETLALLDALLVQAFYTWVLDFSIDFRVHPFESHGPVNRSRLPEEHRDRLLKALPDLTDAEAFAEALRSSVPRVEEYDATRRALVRYVKLMDTTEVEELRASGLLERGDEGEAVEALQKRLAAEGFYGGPINGSFDEVTHEAVVRYQKTHGLAHGGVVGSETVDNLNIPFEWRVKQLLLALGRWRESQIVRRGYPELYIRVNVPAFELHLVERGKVIRRHKTIVGSDLRVEDPLNDGRRWHARRTQLFDTKLNEVVLNPNWIVPEAIRIDEIQPKVQNDSGYLEANNFKKVGDLLVQGPASTNPLGVVKFSLESTDAI